VFSPTFKDFVDSRVFLLYSSKFSFHSLLLLSRHCGTDLSTMSHGSFSTRTPLVIGPMSLSPWVNFNKAWTAVMGYPAEEFKFVPGKTPMSTLTETVSMIVLYLVVIFGGREFMRNRPAYKLNTLFMIHNFCLTAISGALLVLFAEQLVPSLWKGGLYENICGASGWTSPLVVLYYVSSHAQ
jgi:fatty acid elongase 3